MFEPHLFIKYTEYLIFDIYDFIVLWNRHIFSIMFSNATFLQVILTTLLKVYVRGGLFEKSRELINKLDKLGYAEDEVYILLCN